MDNSDIKSIKRRLLILESMLIDIYDTTTTYKKTCPICNNKIRMYVPAGEDLRKNAQCPCCHSFERHRALWLCLKKDADLFDDSKEKKLLHFAPEDCFYEKFSSRTNMDYYPVDIVSSSKNRDMVDIQKIQYNDNMFDVIICNHILEHIPDDLEALRELYRVLNNQNGVAYITVPINKELDRTFENPEYNTPELRLKHYGQSDHVRRYGNDFIVKLKRAGFTVSVFECSKEFTEDELYSYGLLKNEKIFVCKKQE